MEAILEESTINRAKSGYWIRRNQKDDENLFEIDSNNYKEAIESIVLPDVAGQADRLLLMLGDELKDRGPGSAVARHSDRRPATIGALNPSSVDICSMNLGTKAYWDLRKRLRLQVGTG